MIKNSNKLTDFGNRSGLPCKYCFHLPTQAFWIGLTLDFELMIILYENLE